MSAANSGWPGEVLMSGENRRPRSNADGVRDLPRGGGETAVGADGPAAVRLTLLGPMRGWRGRDELDLGPRQQRSILALLLAYAGQPVPMQTLVEMLWADRPPASAINVIHKYVGAIRRSLEPELAPRDSGGWLSRQGNGYRLATDENSSDLMRFASLRRSSQSAESAGDDARALDLIIEALSLWRGSCSAGLGLDGERQATFDAIDRERSEASVEAADLALRLGRPERVLPLLRTAAQSDLLSESLHARTALVLAAVGHQAEALSILRTVRGRLRRDLGVEPGPQVRETQKKVLRQQVVRLPEPASRPDRGAGLPPERPRVQPAELPLALPSFTGRAYELAKAGEFVADRSPDAPAVITVDGMAGIGKSAFAIEMAHRLASRFPDGQLYLDLKGFGPERNAALSPAAALLHLLSGLGTPARSIPGLIQGRSAMYRTALAGKRVMVVLDNARDVEQVRPLLPGSAGSLAIVTSRHSLAELFVTDDAHPTSLRLLSTEASRDTLRRRIGAERAAAEPEAVEEIIALSGRLPLALAGVGARAAANPTFPLAALAAELRVAKYRLDAFSTADSIIAPRTVFSWSYEMLSKDSARLFRLLSQHPGSEITAYACAASSGFDARTSRLLLAELAEASLIFEHAPGRYLVHDLIWAYAAELSAMTDSDHDRLFDQDQRAVTARR